MIDNEDWSKVDDSTLWHAAQGNTPGARDELRKREVQRRMTPAVAAAVARAQK